MPHPASWVAETAALAELPASDRQVLDQLKPLALAAGASLFEPGDPIQGYAIVLSGQVDVSLTTPAGREILLYSVAPGQSCIQSTLGLMGGDTHYTARAETIGPTRLVLLPRDIFDSLMAQSPAFRAVVFAAFSARMKLMMEMLERLAFRTVETRLAERLLKLAAGGDQINITQADLATQIGTAREVVSRHLEKWAARDLLTTGRGKISIRDAKALAQIAQQEF